MEGFLNLSYFLSGKGATAFHGRTDTYTNCASVQGVCCSMLMCCRRLHNEVFKLYFHWQKKMGNLRRWKKFFILNGQSFALQSNEAGALIKMGSIRNFLGHLTKKVKLRPVHQGWSIQCYHKQRPPFLQYELLTQREDLKILQDV